MCIKYHGHSRSRFYEGLNTHFRISATCERSVSLELDPPRTAQRSSLAMNTAVPGAATPMPQPQKADTVCVANEPSTPNHIQLLPPFNMPQSAKDLEADNLTLVLAAQSMDDKNIVLCVGIYDYFTSKCDTDDKGNRGKRVPRNTRRLTQENNRARRELNNCKVALALRQ